MSRAPQGASANGMFFAPLGGGFLSVLGSTLFFISGIGDAGMKYRIIGADKETGDDMEIIVQASGTMAAAEIGNAKGILVTDVMRVDVPESSIPQTTSMPALNAGLDFGPAPHAPPAALAPEPATLVLDPEPALQPADQPMSPILHGESDPPNWFYADGSTQVGPLTKRQLMKLAQQGRVFQDTPVWAEGMPDWVPYRQATLGTASLPLPADHNQAIPAAALQAPATSRPTTACVDKWSYSSGSQRLGPVSENDLRLMLSQGLVSHDTMVWTEGLPTWIPLHQSKIARAPSSAAWPDSAIPPHSANPLVWYGRVFGKYAVFSGRARRTELWWYLLVTFFIAVVLNALDQACGTMITIPVDGRSVAIGGIIGTIYSLATLLPNWAVTVRRIHDTGRTGWWLLMLLVPFVGGLLILGFWLQDSQAGENKYGPNPKGA